MPRTVPADINKAAFAGAPAPFSFSADEKRAYDQLVFFYENGLGYANEMALRPQMLYGLEDSPVGLAAWILDHDAGSYAMLACAIDGQPEGLTKDNILDNITLYWLSDTAMSSARLYWDNSVSAKKGFFDVKGVAMPVVVSAYPMRSIRCRGVGRRRLIPSSFITTSFQGHSLRCLGTAGILC